MAKTDMRLPPLKTLTNDMLIALALLTRLPVPHANFDDESRPAARAAWAYPLVGVAVGGLSLIVWFLGNLFALPHEATALLMVATASLSTGAMHEDGLADCADGFWGAWTKDRRLEIMKDSAIGTYGVLALIVALGLKWVAVSTILLIYALPVWIFIVAAVMSRAAMVGVMEFLPNAREDGLSSQTGRPGKPAFWIALFLALVAAGLAPANALTLLLVMTLSTFSVGALAKSKISGQTGDVLGACQVIVEIALLLALCATNEFIY